MLKLGSLFFPRAIGPGGTASYTFETSWISLPSDKALDRQPQDTYTTPVEDPRFSIDGCQQCFANISENHM